MKIPTYDTLQVGQATTPNSRFTAPSPDQFMGGVRQAAQLGQAASQALDTAGRIQLDVMQQEQDKLDTAAILDATTRLSQFENDSLYGESGYLTRKGKNAMGLAADAQKAHDDFTKQVTADLKLNERQQLAFVKIATQRRQSLAGTLGNYELQQRNAYVLEQADASLAQDVENARRAAGNPDVIDMMLGNSEATIRATAQLGGFSAEKTDQAILAQRSRIRTAALASMVEKDPRAAQAYLDKFRDDFTAADFAKAEQVIVPAVKKVDAIDAAEVAYRVAGITADSVFQGMIGQESRGRHFDDKGQPLTSPKGAVGVAQVMPDTAPEAARLAGLPWDENRYKTDPQYNLALGKAYYNAQVQKYGDPLIAAAAYNAGPGAVDGWLKKYGDPTKGEIALAEWIAKIPYKETRNYVAGLVRDGTGGGVDRSTTQAVAALQGIRDPEVRGMAEKLVREKLAADKQARDEQYAGALDQAAAIVQQSGSFANIPPSLWAQLKPEDRAKLQQGPVKSSDPNTLAMFEFQPETITVQNVQKARPNLTESDFRKYMAIAQDPKRDDKVFEVSIDSDMFKLGIAQAGIEFDGDKQEKATQELDLRMKFKRMIDQEQQEKKRKLTMDEKQALLGMLLKPVKIRAIENSWFGGPSPTTMDVPFFRVKNQQNVIIPSETRRRIEQDFAARGIQATPQRVLNAYLALKDQ